MPIALVENLLRQDLTPAEEAEALQRLLAPRACQQNDLAELIGKSKATISLSLSLNRLPAAIRDACRQGRGTCHPAAEADQGGGHNLLPASWCPVKIGTSILHGIPAT